MQVHRRLQDEHGYGGCYGQVQGYVFKHRRGQRETFIPLGHLSGPIASRRILGHIHVDFPEGRRLVSFLVTTWAYSNYPFVLALPFERTEAILEGMVTAFSSSSKPYRRKSGGTTLKQLPPWSFSGGNDGSIRDTPRAGQPLRLQAALLHAGSWQRKA